MVKDTIQLSMFQSDEPVQPLPLQLATRYRFRLQYHQLDNDVIVYSIQDWVMGLTGGDGIKASQILREFKKQLRSQPTYFKYPVVSPNGKTYQMDFVEDLTLYKFAAYSRAIEKRPQIKEIKDFLAAAGVMADEIRQDPEEAQRKIAAQRTNQAHKSGKSEAWIAQREMGVITRNELTAMVTRICPQMNIGEMTNIGYKGTLGHDAKGLRKVLEIGEKQNPRDHMSEVGLAYTMVHEATVRAHLEGYEGEDLVSPETVRKVIETTALSIGKQAKETALLLGVDIVTGQKLLGRGS